MKKIFFVFLSLAFFSINLFSQEKIAVDSIHSVHSYFYAGLDGGYGFSALRQELTYENHNDTYQNVEKGVYGSLGRGIVAGVYGGYMINKHLGFETGFSDLQGISFKANSVTTQYILTSTEEFQATMMRANFGMRLSVSKGKLQLYSRTSFLIGFSAKLYYDETSKDNLGLPGETSITYSGGFSFGFKGGVGISYVMNNHFSVFGELGVVFQNWAPTKSIMTKGVDKGVDYLSTLSVSQIQTVYVNSFSTINNSPTISNLPGKQLKFYYPFSSVGINVGIQYKFGKVNHDAHPKN